MKKNIKFRNITDLESSFNNEVSLFKTSQLSTPVKITTGFYGDGEIVVGTGGKYWQTPGPCSAYSVIRSSYFLPFVGTQLWATDYYRTNPTNNWTKGQTQFLYGNAVQFSLGFQAERLVFLAAVGGPNGFIQCAIRMDS